MFKFTKSETDLGKLAWPTQYKVICDWMRNIYERQGKANMKLNTIVLDIAKLYDLLQSDSPSEEPVVHPDDDSTSTESVY